MKFKKVTLNDILKEESESVYVLNNASAKESRRTGAGVILLTISVGNEGNKSLFIPNTWVPMDLSAQVPKADLIKSTGFRQCVNINAITLVLSAEAEDFLKNDRDAEIEYEKANQDLMSNNNFILDESGENDPDNDREQRLRENKERNQKLLDKQKKQLERAEISIENSLANDINLRLQEIAEMPDLSEQEYYSLVRSANNSAPFTEKDCRFVLAHTSHNKVKMFVANLLTEKE